MRRPTTVAAVLAATLALPAFAAAGTVAVTSTRVTSGFAAVSSCGSFAGVSASWTSMANVVVSLVLTGLPSGCVGVGAVLAGTLAGSGGASLGTIGPTTLTATTQTFTITGTPTATSVTSLFVSVTGP